MRVPRIRPAPVDSAHQNRPGRRAFVRRLVLATGGLAFAGPDTQLAAKHRWHSSPRELLASDVPHQVSTPLLLPLGTTSEGAPLLADLASMPHVLIAGCEGIDKSVAVHAMLTGILGRATPEDVRLILIDASEPELVTYRDIPHLVTPPVVGDPTHAATALGWALREMEGRYRTLAREGVRNIRQYNHAIRLHAQRDLGLRRWRLEPKPRTGPLSYLVVSIAELADVIGAPRRVVENAIARLAQMGRAVGIHLIVATQRPAWDVLTACIRVVVPSRIAFRVSTRAESRAILDRSGAEQLRGRRALLYLPGNASRCLRLRGARVSESDTERLCRSLRTVGTAGTDGLVSVTPRLT